MDLDQQEKDTPLQTYLFDLYEVYRQQTRQRNPSDAKFAKWLGLTASTLNHWQNGTRVAPDLRSLISVSNSLRRHGVKDPYHIFDVMKVDRLYVGHNERLNYLIEFWDYLPEDMKAEIINIIEAHMGKAGDDSKNQPK